MSINANVQYQPFSRTGSYASMFYLLTVVVIVLALLAWFVKVPLSEHAT